jgi:hypothetical protein
MLIVQRRRVSAYDTDAQTYITAVEAADGQSLETATKDAINTLVMALKANSIWTNAAQLLLPCGPRTLAGALRPLKGAVPTNANFVSGNYNRKNGLGKASNTTAYLNSNVAVDSVGATSHALFAYGSISQNSGDTILIGRYDGSTYSTIIFLDEWSTYLSGRAFRSATITALQIPIVTSTAAATCMIGSRVSSTSATLYVDGTSVTNTNSNTLTLSSQSFLIYGWNNNATVYSSAILQATGIFSTGLNATQAAALRSAIATYVASIAAAF